MPKLNPFTAAIPKPASRGTITLTGEEYDELVQRVRCRALEEAAEICLASAKTRSAEQYGDPWDAGCVWGWNSATEAIQALIEREKNPSK